MKALKIAVLHLIVIAICIISILGYFFAPIFSANLPLTFTKDLADIIFIEPNENATEEEKFTYTFAMEVASQNLTFNLKIKVNVSDILNCAFDDDLSETKRVLLDFTDNLARHIGEEKKDEIELAITKAILLTKIKLEITDLTSETNQNIDSILLDAGINDQFITDKTNDVLTALKEENATVDSVAESVVLAIEDVYLKLENSPYSDSVTPLSPEEKEILTESVKEIINSIADENGNIDGENLFFSLITQLLGQNSQTSEQVATPIKFNSGNNVQTANEIADQGETDSEIVTTLKTEFAKLITDDICQLAKQGFKSAVYSLCFSLVFWLFLIIKILLKTTSKNPFVKLKSPIIFGWTPFVSLYILPTAFFKLLSAPPAFLIDIIGAKNLSFISSIFGGATATFSTSAIYAAICAGVLFIFGLYYATQRKKFLKESNHSQKKTKKTKK